MKKCKSFYCQNETEKNFCSDSCRVEALVNVLRCAESYFGWGGSQRLADETKLLIDDYTPKEYDIAESCDPKPRMPSMVRFPDSHRDGLD